MGVADASLLKILLLLTALAAAVLLIDLEIAGSGDSGCGSSSPSPAAAANSTDLDAAFRELIARRWLSTSDLAICVGPGSGPAVTAMRKLGFRAPVGAPATACCGLPFAEDSFDFAFSAALDRVRVPARVVLEMERVIRPGRFGAVFRRRRSGPARPSGLMRAAAPVASLLRSSDVVGARTVNGSAMVVFRKRAGPGPASGTTCSSICEDELTKLPLILNEIIDQVKGVFWSELIKF